MDPALFAGVTAVAGVVTGFASALGPVWNEWRKRRKLVDQRTLRITIDGQTIEIQSSEKTKDLDARLRKVLADLGTGADDAEQKR